MVFSSVKSSAANTTARPGKMLCLMDTVPAVKAVEAQPAQQSENVEVVPTVIKQVPKSRKQVKPVAVPKIVTTKPKAIIKPKIVIKTGLIR
jgi:hypothetical protein